MIMDVISALIECILIRIISTTFTLATRFLSVFVVPFFVLSLDKQSFINDAISFMDDISLPTLHSTYLL